MLVLSCRFSAGRQLLVDFHYLSQWLTSDGLRLLPTTVQSLSSLPVVAEIERGLLLLSGADTSATDAVPRGDSSGTSPHTDFVRGYSSLSVWSEIGCYSPTDWRECML